jgi:branched-subunit amino acid aminotransferase/4-amino-4-deoxychorismate lyase
VTRTAPAQPNGCPSSGTVLVWRPGEGFSPSGPEPAGPLHAADSWLVENGMVRGLPYHHDRFMAACRAADVLPMPVVGEFWQATLGQLPRTGRWWPRIELPATAGPLRLRLRPAPSPAGPVRLHMYAGGDPRVAPRRKGPDLHRLAALRASVSPQSGDEVLLTTTSGLILETTTGSVLWWEEDQLCVPSPSLRLLPGITTTLISEIAEQVGVTVRYCRRRMVDLDGREVWVANALHGIRPVAQWFGVPGWPGSPIRAAAWQSALSRCQTPLHGETGSGEDLVEYRRAMWMSYMERGP